MKQNIFLIKNIITGINLKLLHNFFNGSA